MKLKLAFFAFVLASSSLSMASNYPGDYTINSSQQTQGPVRVTRALQPGRNLAVLELLYKGQLQRNAGLRVWIKVHYLDGDRQGLFMAEAFNENSTFFRITGGCLVGVLGGCAKYGTPEMRDLLFWAQQPTGRLNALDFEVAFVDAYNHWDNNGGENYRFHFIEQ